MELLALAALGRGREVTERFDEINTLPQTRSVCRLR